MPRLQDTAYPRLKSG